MLAVSDKQAYEVVIGGVRHTMLYSADEAKRRGLKPVRAQRSATKPERKRSKPVE